jgi:hypothetical protein
MVFLPGVGGRPRGYHHRPDPAAPASQKVAGKRARPAATSAAGRDQRGRSRR